MRFKAGTDECVLGAGGFVYLPRGLMHQPMVEGEHSATVLGVLSRPGLEDFFAEFSSELENEVGRRPWSCWTELACHMACGISRHNQARPGGEIPIARFHAVKFEH
jgi:Cupin superfamily protein